MESYNGGQTFNRQFSISDMLPYIQAPEGEKPVELRSVDIQVRITGIFAQTTQTLRIFNPNGRILEGTVCFPLPDNAVVCGYALDIEGNLVDGVVVGKQKARQILEAEERKGADPGLVEQVHGNIYRTRVYPITAQGARTVQVTYVSDLTMQGNDAAYHLPLAHASHIPSVTLAIEVVQSPVMPVLTGGIGNMALRQTRQSWVAEATLEHGTPTEDLQIRIPNLPDVFSMGEQAASGETFFCVSAATSVEANQLGKWRPQRIGIAWDASFSRDKSIDKDLAFLNILAGQWPETKIDVLVFRDVMEQQIHTIDLRLDGVDKLTQMLRGLAYDGGTNFSGLDLTAHSHSDIEAWFLFSDGLSTMSTGLPRMGNTQLYTVSSQSHCNAGLLTYFAETGKGQHINLLRTSCEDAAQLLVHRMEPVGLAEQKGCDCVYVINHPGRVSVTGRLSGEHASIRLSGAGMDKLIVLKQTDATRGELLARTWAGMEARRETVVSGEGAASVLALGRKYGLVTPGTSLLVLENLSQYLEYEVEPPASLAEMRVEYRKIMDQRLSAKTEAVQNQIENVVRLWQQRVQWWETRFDAQKIKTQQKKLAEEINGPFDGGGPDFNLTRSRPAPAASMASSVSLSQRSTPQMADTACVEGAEPLLEASAKSSPRPSSTQASIKIQPWSPDNKYLSAIRNVDEETSYRSYLLQRDQYRNSPSFMLDVSDYFLKEDRARYGLRILSNLLEQGLDDVALMRIYGWRLQQAERLDQAVEIFARVLQQRDDEPQSHRDLALVLAQRWEQSADTNDILRAMELLYHVVSTQWPRFPEIEIIALMELNRLIDRAASKDIATPEYIDSRLLRNLDLDVRISLSWDADLTDVDLHVFEPTGEHAYYGHNRTAIGGLVSRDFTQGYGPEEYVLRRAVPGAYVIKAHYYGSHQQTLCGPCTVTATVFTNYARDTEHRQVLTLRLDKPHNEVVIGEVTIGAEQLTAMTSENDSKIFKELTKGMSVDDVVQRLGQPNEITGSPNLQLTYRVGQDREIRITMSPLLSLVQEITKDTITDIVK